MHGSICWIAATIVGAGILLAGWGPVLAAALTGVRLPDSLAADPAALSAWAGMGLLRVLGGALVMVGAVVWVMGRGTVQQRAVYQALFFSALLGFAVAAAQVFAVWLTPFSALLTLPFALALLAGWLGMRESRSHVRGAA